MPLEHAPHTLFRDIDPRHGFESQLLEPGDPRVETALELESRVWNEKYYGSLDDYVKYFGQSRIFVAFNGDICLGVSRVFKGNPELPPFMELPISSDSTKQQLLNGCSDGTVEELGTVAVDSQNAPFAAVAKALWRLAYRNARYNGVETWGIIMEPRRAETMNKRYGFTFEQIGPAIEYQGGDCAAHITDLQHMIESMQQTHPDRYNYFVTDPLNYQ